MVSLHCAIRRAHPDWLIFPAVLLLSIAGAVVGHSQDSDQVALAAEVPDALYRSQTVRLESPPPNPEELGDAFMLHQRFQAAIESYRKATPTSDIWNKMGIAYQMMNGSDGALRCYKESLKLDPKNAHALNNLGSLHFGLREFAPAERMYRKALALEPDSAIVQLNLGTDLIAERKYEDGWQHYQTALEMDPHVLETAAVPRIGNPGTAQNRGAVNYYLARVFARAGMMSSAVARLRLALNQGFTNPRKIEADVNFAALREFPDYQVLLSQTGRP